MTLSQYVRLHVEAGRVFRLLAAFAGPGHARRACEKWEAWCPRAAHGYRTKGRG